MRNRRPKLILWDIDGTLVLFRGAGRRAAERAFEEVFALADAGRRTQNVQLAGATDGKILREMAAACGIRDADFQQKRGLVKDAYLRQLASEIAHFEGDAALPGAREKLAEFSSLEDFRSGLLTGNYEEGARMKLEPCGLYQYFGAGGFGDDDEDRRIVASMARDRASAFHQIRVDASNVYVIGDTIHDADCAEANGFRCIAVRTGRFSRDELQRAGAAVVLNDLTELDRGLFI